MAIERYDRSSGLPQGRIHQEDFNQALGAGGTQKYQKYGGRVSLARIAQVLSMIGDRASLDRLLRLTVLSLAVGNLDMHAKNVSLLHRPDGSMTLAPAYDTVPQAHHLNDGEMAFAIGQEYRPRVITRDQLVAEGHSWGGLDAEAVVDDALTAILETASSEVPHPKAFPHLAGNIIRFTTNLMALRSVGPPG